MRYRRLTLRLVHTAPVAPAGPLGWGGSAAVAHEWRPPIDVCETADRLTVAVEVPGLVEDRTDVVLYQDGLVIEGERQVEACGPEGRYHVAEIRQGAFHVEIVLPVRVEAERVAATYGDGILHVDLPKASDIDGDGPRTVRPG